MSHSAYAATFFVCFRLSALAHQALGFAKLALQEFHALTQLFLGGQYVLDAHVSRI